MKTILATLALLLGACGGFCGAGPGEVEASLYVSDAATGASVRQPEFTSDGTPLGASCQDPSAHDPLLCASWLLVGPPSRRSITVTATGYSPATVIVDTTTNESIHLAVEMRAL
jgi:hypothetical protein